MEFHFVIELLFITGKNNRFPFLDILGYLKNTYKNPKFGRVRQVPTRELGNIQTWESVIFSCARKSSLLFIFWIASYSCVCSNWMSASTTFVLLSSNILWCHPILVFRQSLQFLIFACTICFESAWPSLTRYTWNMTNIIIKWLTFGTIPTKLIKKPNMSSVIIVPWTFWGSWTNCLAVNVVIHLEYDKAKGRKYTTKYVNIILIHNSRQQ